MRPAAAARQEPVSPIPGLRLLMNPMKLALADVRSPAGQ